jgi:hypothetical protein
VKPPENIARMIMAPRTDISFTNQSPDGRWFLRTRGADRGDIKAYGAPHIWLGGLQVDTRANRARSVTTSTRTGLTLVDPVGGAEKQIGIPAGTTMSAPVWSPRGTHIAFMVNYPTASYAYVADVLTGRITRLSERPLLATMVTDIDFTAELGGRALHRHQVLHAGLLRALAEVLDHVGLGVDGVDAALRRHVGEAHREVAGAGADVRHDGVGRKLQRLDHLVRLLPGVARRVIPACSHGGRVGEAVVVAAVMGLMATVRAGRGREESDEDERLGHGESDG